MRNSILLSVLIPTRKRDLILKETIQQIYNLLGTQIPIEVCLKIDFDDKESINLFSNLDLPNLRILISERGRGYEDLPEYWSDLYSLSTGTFIMFWSDDAFLKEAGNLSDLLIEHRDKPSIIISERTCHFPVVHYKFIECMREKHGHREGKNIFSDLLYVDGYFQTLWELIPTILPREFATYRYSHTYWHTTDKVPLLSSLMSGYGEALRETAQSKADMLERHSPRSGISLSRVYEDSLFFKEKLGL